MKYNPKIHHRRSIRLKGYDYSQAGAYFITICCKDMKCLFGKIENGEMIMNEFGQIAFDEWINLSERFANSELDVFQIMPNHMHGILVLTDTATIPENPEIENNIPDIGGGLDDAEKENDYKINNHQAMPYPAPTTMGDMMGGYKSIVANDCLKIWKSRWAGADPAPIMGKIWHRNLYEHIIRNEHSHQNISNYIINNPKNWKDDKFFNQ